MTAPQQGQPDDQGGEVVPFPGGNDQVGSQRQEAVRVPLLADEERSLPVVRPALRLAAIDILEHGIQPADIARTLARMSLGQLLWDPKYAEWLAWSGTHWKISQAGWEDQHQQGRRRGSKRSSRNSASSGSSSSWPLLTCCPRSGPGGRPTTAA